MTGKWAHILYIAENIMRRKFICPIQHTEIKKLNDNIHVIGEKKNYNGLWGTTCSTDLSSLLLGLDGGKSI